MFRPSNAHAHPSDRALAPLPPSSKLPYEVAPDQAMSHQEVRVKLEASHQTLRSATDKVLNSIVSSLDNIP